MILPAGDDPNVAGTTLLGINPVGPDANGESNILVPEGVLGKVWMRIYNNQDDYKDSTGLYNVQFSTPESMGSFTVQILTPLFETLQDKIKAASATIFKNMTCYTGGQSDATCTTSLITLKLC